MLRALLTPAAVATVASMAALAAALAPGAPAAPIADAQLRAIAALRGEPSSVSAAGLTQDDVRIPTLENDSAYGPEQGKRRLVVVGPGGADRGGAGPGAADPDAAGNGRGAAAVLAFVRWFKTLAPSRLKEQWSVSALPWLGFDAADTSSLERWVTFQAPDLVVEIRDGTGGTVETPGALSTLGTLRTLGKLAASTKSEVVGSKDATAAIEKLLSSAPGTRSPLHDAIGNRTRREPLQIARLLANRYPETASLSYIPSVAWTSTLRLAAATGDRALSEKVREQTNPLRAADQLPFGNRIQLTAVAGTMVFADLGGDDWNRALEGARLASARKDDGTATYGQGWTDDMFMASAILSRVGRNPDHRDALDAAARLLVDYAARLQRPDGLFIHAVEGPFPWGRGNGFAALGLMEVLTGLPDRDPARARILEIYTRLMAGARTQQAPDGMWREVVDEPGAYREETATAMLMTAMARGIRLGWIGRDYLPVFQRAWRALAAHVGEDGTLLDVCASTGAGPTRRYYLDRPAITGADDRGGAMALLAAMEAYDLAKGNK